MTRSLLLLFVAASCLACVPQRPPPVCSSIFTQLCDGDELFEIDSCDDSATPVLVTDCPQACHLGACIDCVPDAGLACEGDDLVVTDSCGATERVVQTCPNGCADAACIPAECTPDDDVLCVGNLIFSVDSCGNTRDFVERCPATNPCENGACRDCFLPERIGCFEHDIYEYDACGRQLGLAAVCDGEHCEDNDTFTTAQCAAGTPNEASCTPNAGVVCHEGDLHFRDACFNVQPDIQRACDFGCDADLGCIEDCPTVTIGQVCLDGNVHGLERGCPGTVAAPGPLRESCDAGCASGLCVDGPCAPNAGVVCDGQDVIVLDSCGERGDVLESCEGVCQRGACQ